LRESARRIGGRTHEIQRLIGRSLRAVVDFQMLGQRTVWIDCDVIRRWGRGRHRSPGVLSLFSMPSSICAHGIIPVVPCGFCGGDKRRIVAEQPLLDLSYQEDSAVRST
jgi:ribonuclease PH